MLPTPLFRVCDQVRSFFSDLCACSSLSSRLPLSSPYTPVPSLPPCQIPLSLFPAPFLRRPPLSAGYAPFPRPPSFLLTISRLSLLATPHPVSMSLLLCSHMPLFPGRSSLCSLHPCSQVSPFSLLPKLLHVHKSPLSLLPMPLFPDPDHVSIFDSKFETTNPSDY